MEARPEGMRELAFHMDRLNSWMRVLWAAESLDLYMCDGSVRENHFGLLQNIRMDVMALRAAILEVAFALPLDGGSGQVPGMPTAICHACGLGIRCRNEHCPNVCTETAQEQPNAADCNVNENGAKGG